mgnify:CR=1 FL=1
MAEQCNFKRYEMKYLITSAQRDALKEYMKTYMIEDCHGKSVIQSVYLDTPDFLLARRSMEHPLYKEKLRMRSYGVADAQSTCFLELKKKYDAVVYKRRECMSRVELEQYIQCGTCTRDSQIMRELKFAMGRYPDIAPAIHLSYEREAYYQKNDDSFRITMDENILWRIHEVNLGSGIGGTPILEPDQILVEVKTAGAIPLWLVNYFSREHIYKTSFSKYGRAYSMLQNSLL